MPGQGADKQDSYTEALLQGSMDTSAAARVSSSTGSALRNVSVEADAALPSTTAQGATLSQAVQSQQPRLGNETIAESGPRPWFFPLSSEPQTASPSPTPANLTLPSQMCAIHPLAPPLSPPLASPVGPTPAALPVSPAVGTATAALPGSSPRRPDSSSGSLTILPPGAACTVSSCARAPSSTGQLQPAGSGNFAPECRICLLPEPLSDLVAPCHCTGSMAYAHMVCLKTWVIEKRSIHCELCNTMYKEPYGSELAASIPPAPPPPPPHAMVRRFTAPDGQPIIIMPVGVGLGPNTIGPLLQQHAAGGVAGGTSVVADPRDVEPQSLCEWRNMWSYALIMLLLLFAIIYVTVISRRGKQEAWMKTLWRVLLVVLPIYLVLRVAFDLYRHRLAQQLAAANMQAVALANVAAADAAAVAGQHGAGQREVIITRAGNRVLVLQRAVP